MSWTPTHPISIKNYDRLIKYHSEILKLKRLKLEIQDWFDLNENDLLEFSFRDMLLHQKVIDIDNWLNEK